MLRYEALDENNNTFVQEFNLDGTIKLIDLVDDTGQRSATTYSYNDPQAGQATITSVDPNNADALIYRQVLALGADGEFGTDDDLLISYEAPDVLQLLDGEGRVTHIEATDPDTGVFSVTDYTYDDLAGEASIAIQEDGIQVVSQVYSLGPDGDFGTADDQIVFYEGLDDNNNPVIQEFNSSV